MTCPIFNLQLSSQSELGFSLFICLSQRFAAAATPCRKAILQQLVINELIKKMAWLFIAMFMKALTATVV